MAKFSNADGLWQGTQLAREALRTDEPYAHLSHACSAGEKSLRKLAGFVAATIMEVDWLDKEADLQHCQLAKAVHYGDVRRAHGLAVRLEQACTARDRTADFLRRLLICYRAAARLDNA